MTPCIIFKGGRQYPNKGYGIRWVAGKCWLAHRYAYYEAFGSIPDGLYVCHKCNNKGCINPEHLYLATPRQNILDASRDGLMKGVNQHAKKTCCPRCGSEFQRTKRGSRICRRCCALVHAKGDRRRKFFKCILALNARLLKLT